MATVKTAISLDESLFEKVEALARELKLSRSRVFALALEEFIRRRENALLLERIDEAYADGPDAEETDYLRRMRQLYSEAIHDEWR